MDFEKPVSSPGNGEKQQNFLEQVLALELLIQENPEVEKLFEYCRDLELALTDFTKTILDVGAKDADFMRGADQLGLGENIVSLDLIQPEDMNLSESQKERLIIAAAEKMPLPDALFDFVVAKDMLQYFDDHEKMSTDSMESTISCRLGEMWRVLKPGGTIKFTVAVGGGEKYQARSDATIGALQKFEIEKGVKWRQTLLWPGDTDSLEQAQANGLMTPYLFQTQKPREI